MFIAGLLLLGMTAGIFSGMVGVGGGIIIVPALVYLFNLTQQQAQGTTLALMVPPVGILAALAYYKQGFVDLRVAAIVCLGFTVGGWLGARYATGLPTVLLQRVFGVSIVLIGLKMLWVK